MYDTTFLNLFILIKGRQMNKSNYQIIDLLNNVIYF